MTRYSENRGAAARGRSTAPEGSMLDIFREEIYGKAEWECGRAKPWIVTTCVMYALMAAAIIVSVLNGTPLFALPGAAMVCFIIWRIYRLHCSVALVCREKLLILAAGKFSRGRGIAFLAPRSGLLCGGVQRDHRIFRTVERNVYRSGKARRTDERARSARIRIKTR